MIDSFPIHLPATFRGIPKRVSSLHPTISPSSSNRSALLRHSTGTIYSDTASATSSLDHVLLRLWDVYLLATSNRWMEGWRTDTKVISPGCEDEQRKHIASHQPLPRMEENDRMPNGYGSLTNKVSVGLADLAFASSLPISSFFGSQSSSSWSADEQTNTTHTRSHEHGLDTTRHAEVRYIRPALTKACSTRELALSNPPSSSDLIQASDTQNG